MKQKETPEEQEIRLGLRCPRCECCDFRTVKTWPDEDGIIRRYRICRNCGKHVRTVEQAG
jgi:transcriptional regulator NrdR family protein